MRILNVVGARPNLVKIAPLIKEMHDSSEIEPVLLHTGQHYDDNLSRIFFDELGIPQPDVYLGVGSGTNAAQTARLALTWFLSSFIAAEPICQELVLARHGPVHSCAQVCQKVCNEA